VKESKGTGLSKPIESSLLEAVKKVQSELDNVELLINRLFLSKHQARPA
jgi:hypothetical protein